MSVRSNSKYEEAEESGEAELVLVSLTYVGSRSMFRSPAVEQQGRYPSLDPFQNGVPKIVLLDSRGLPWWESHADFEISYDEADLADTLLGANYLPEQIVGPGFDQQLRDRMLDKLGIEGFTTEEDLRGKLAEIAGRDEEEVEEAASRPDRRSESLASDVDRSVLIKVASSYDEEFDDWREENTDAAQVTHVQTTDLAAFLAGRDRGEVNRRIDTAEAGGEV